MKQKVPNFDVIVCRVLPTRCPGCGKAGEPRTDGKWPAKTLVQCPHGCGWEARYQQREPVTA